MKIIELKNISFAYENRIILDKFNLSVEEGSMVLLSGPNGCGKTTLLKILNGLRFPSSGSFLFNSEPVTEKLLKDDSKKKAFHQKIGYVFQNPDVQLFCNNVFDEVAFGPRQMGLSDQDIERRVKDCLSFFDIYELKERAPYHLSGGEKRKVAIASVMAMNPEVYIFDEPTNDLDRDSKKKLFELIKGLKQNGKTIICVSHDLDMSELADHVVKM